MRLYAILWITLSILSIQGAYPLIQRYQTLSPSLATRVAGLAPSYNRYHRYTQPIGYAHKLIQNTDQIATNRLMSPLEKEIEEMEAYSTVTELPENIPKDWLTLFRDRLVEMSNQIKHIKQNHPIHHYPTLHNRADQLLDRLSVLKTIVIKRLEHELETADIQKNKESEALRPEPQPSSPLEQQLKAAISHAQRIPTDLPSLPFSPEQCETEACRQAMSILQDIRKPKEHQNLYKPLLQTGEDSESLTEEEIEADSSFQELLKSLQNMQREARETINISYYPD
jgi:hypothetical protein